MDGVRANPVRRRAFLFVLDKSVGSLTVRLPGPQWSRAPNGPRHGADPGLC